MPTSTLDAEVVQLVQEIQMRLADVEAQLEIMRPLAAKIVERVSGIEGHGALVSTITEIGKSYVARHSIMIAT
jgi:hypothetical protein